MSSEKDTESELDLGESASDEPGSSTRLPFGLSVRGLQGTAAVLGFITIVSAAVIGGALAVDSVARFDGDRPDGSALLEDSQLNGLRPSPSPGDWATERDEGGQADGGEKAPAKKDDGSGAKGDSADKNKGSDKKSSPPAADGKQVDQVNSEKDADDESRPRRTSPPARLGVIRNLATGQCIDLPDAGVPAVGTGVNQYTCLPGATDNQDFELVEQFGELMLRNLKTNYCLDLPGTEGVEAGAVVIVGPCQAGDTDNQMFRPRSEGDGYYLVNVKSGLCLDVSGFRDAERQRPGQVLTMYPCSPDDDHVWTVG